MNRNVFFYSIFILIITYVDKNYLIIPFGILAFLILPSSKRGFLLFTFVNVYLAYVLYTNYKFLDDKSVYFNPQIMLWIFASSFIPIYFYAIKNIDDVIKGLKIALCFFSIIIIIQTISHYFLFDIDFYKIFGGSEPQRAYDGSLYRPGAVFLEPGTYGTFVGPLVILYCYISKKFDKYIFLALSGLFLTFSTFAHFYFIISILILFKDKIFSSIRNFCLFLFPSFILLIPALLYTYKRFSTMSLDAGTISKKIYAWDFLINQNWDRIIWGIGIGHNDCGCLYADTGLIFSTFFILGIYSIILVIFVVVLAKKKNALSPLLLIPLFTKIEFHHPLLWFYIFTVINFVKYKKETGKK